MNILTELEKLSTAEEFFQRLDVAYDPAIVRVARLHILRRMGQYLEESRTNPDFADAGEDALFALCKEHLARAYADFVASSPIEERLFKVHQDALQPKAEPQVPFVPIESLGALADAGKDK